jgi:hypothetical protein
MLRTMAEARTRTAGCYIGQIAIHNNAGTISAAVESMTPHIATSAPSKR